jgi:translation elongation factor EF-G
MADKHLGQLSFVRIYSGTVTAGSYVYNTIKNQKERVGRVMWMHANKREDIDSASAGEIVAIGGMKTSRRATRFPTKISISFSNQWNFPTRLSASPSSRKLVKTRQNGRRAQSS